ncbi:MAG: phosphoribosylformylglycinamidine synthase subunit PurS [Gemmatimonadetes bacterium]|nr:phosphoribosylformylglycinamidine synthase subunit PurS [Gemmatimonadota bacterium]MCA9761567.1 phosphoribosylformylglycinamidine synthase subunit PurS [Gemmatimonadota bacterium]MCA9768977.1 phosphoribosylformylglycinamidine synthase subunit PurS [Gemmatimonadota bacterium]MCB9517476.1 phosphoribosylformylglycinamidine synthase subunit PurS [Gemmatimonadales bacterium]
MTFRVHVRVVPRPGLLDPQGQAVAHALAALGFPGVGEVRVGRAIELELEADDRATAEAAATAMCERLLANPVTEDFTVAVEG